MIFGNKHTGLRLVLFFFLIVVLIMFRRPDLLFRSQFWAEDGAVFFAGQVNSGFWKSVFVPYSGYLHLVPRLIAAIASFAPVRWAPLAFYICSVGIASFCCSAFYWPCFRRIVSSDALRAACCMVVAGVIPAGGELIMSACTLQVFLVVITSLLLYRNWDDHWSADRRLGVEVPLAITQILTALSAPATLLFTPILAWQSIRNRGWRRFIPVVVMLALAVQIFVAAHSNQARPRITFNSIVLSTAASGVSRSILSPVLGQAYLLRVKEDRGLMVRLLLGLSFSLVMVSALLFSQQTCSDQTCSDQTCSDQTWERRRLVMVAIYLGVGSVAFAMAGRGLSESFLTWDGIRHSQGERYYFVSSCTFIFLIALAIDRWLRILPGPVKAILMLGIFIGGFRQNFSVPPLADLSWPESARKIVAWKEAQAHGEHPDVLPIPINPPGFSMALAPRN